MKERCWDVKMYWRTSGHGVYESGVNTLFPENMGPMEVIAECARWRGVDLNVCHSIVARVVGEPDEP